MPDELQRLTLERDLLLGLLSLGDREDLEPFLTEALSLIARLTGAAQGMLELGAPALRILHGLTPAEAEGARRETSTGIIAEALASGRTVSTASALEDPRFAGQASVKAHRIRAVLCAPLASNGARGVVYLSGRREPGPFSEQDRQLAELFARQCAPLVQRLADKAERAESVDATAPYRARLALDRIAGTSRALAEVFRQLQVAAPVPVSVLVTGESGTGKTALARALHDSSPRSAGPFVELNCAAIPETLFESELFGAEKGAHSTATRRIDGKIDAARGGTLFLDEVGEMPLSVQGKLLGFLQSRRFFRLGGTAPIEADVRVVAATNRDLRELAAEKRFREDLYYRLDVLRIGVPPLRERSEDIAPIAKSVLARLGREHGRALTLSRSACAALEECEWPGNVRELENAVSRGWATALAEGAARVEGKHLFSERVEDGPSDDATYQEAMRRFQKKFLAEALEACHGNVSETARRIGVARSHLNELLKAHGLSRRE